MKIAIVTAGAVGTYFGGRLALHGGEIRFVARGAHLAALHTTGLTLKTTAGPHHLALDSYFATDDATEAVRGADLVLLACKSYDTASVAQAFLPGLGASTPVLSLQNGLGNEELLAEIVGPERVAGGAAYIFAVLDGPGQVLVSSNFGRLVIADQTLTGAPLPHLDEFRQLCAVSEIPCEVAPDIWKVKWNKLVINSAVNGWTALHQTTLDRLLHDPEIRPAILATMQETVAVAQAAGINLDKDVFEKTLALVESLGPAGSSMLDDRLHGKRLEIEALNGILVRKGHQLGVPTPYNAQLYHALKDLG
jgi:2-dehydropantoate 2-reductase